MNEYNESNFRIQREALNPTTFFVRSDSERFGTDAIVYQGISYEECLNYIAAKTGNIEVTYYVIKDLATWRSDLWNGDVPAQTPLEKFSTVEEAIARFNEYKAMDYLRTPLINPDNNLPMRRLTLGVSQNAGDLDLLHTENEKTLALSDVLQQRKNGYEFVMTNANFIRDFAKIVSEIKIDEYSYYRPLSREELVKSIFDNPKFEPEEVDQVYKMRLAEYRADEYIKKHPNCLIANQVNERMAFDVFLQEHSFLHLGAQNVGAEFRAKTEKMFHNISELNAMEIEEIVRRYVSEKLENAGIEANIVDVLVSGSRARGLEKEGSDLDVVVQLDSTEREDDLFSVLNEDCMHIGDVNVDINPIKEDKTGPLEIYLPQVEQYLGQKALELEHSSPERNHRHQVMQQNNGMLHRHRGR